MQEKRYSESAGATEQALKMNGNNYLVWNNLMLAYEGAKQSDKAEAARRKTEELAEKVVQTETAGCDGAIDAGESVRKRQAE